MAEPIVFKVPTTRGEICISIDPLDESVSVMGASAVEVTVPFRTQRHMEKPDDAYVVSATAGGHDGDLTVGVQRQGQPWWPRFLEPRLVLFTTHSRMARDAGRPPLEFDINVQASGGRRDWFMGRMPLTVEDPIGPTPHEFEGLTH